jgi:hypothetical protein
LGGEKPLGREMLSGRLVASSLLHLVAEVLSVCFENGRTQHAFPVAGLACAGHVVNHFPENGTELLRNLGMASNGEK